MSKSKCIYSITYLPHNAISNSCKHKPFGSKKKPIYNGQLHIIIHISIMLKYVLRSTFHTILDCKVRSLNYCETRLNINCMAQEEYDWSPLIEKSNALHPIRNNFNKWEKNIFFFESMILPLSLMESTVSKLNSPNMLILFS